MFLHCQSIEVNKTETNIIVRNQLYSLGAGGTGEEKAKWCETHWCQKRFHYSQLLEAPMEDWKRFFQMQNTGHFLWTEQILIQIFDYQASLTLRLRQPGEKWELICSPWRGMLLFSLDFHHEYSFYFPVNSENGNIPH